MTYLKRNKTKMSGKKAGFILLSIIPAFFLFILFNIVPTLETFRMSFFEGSLVGGESLFVGFGNYLIMFKNDKFLLAFGNTLFYMFFATIITIFLAMLFAFVLSKTKIKGKKFFRFVFYIPNILSIVVITAIFSNVFASEGLLNGMLDALGLGAFAKQWISDDSTVKNSILFIMIWQAVGYYMIMYVAGMDGIDPCIYESANIDGATGFIKFFKITVPMTWNILRVTFSLYIIGSINLSFLIINAMLGVEAGVAEVLLNIMYFESNLNYGYSMAIGTFMFAFTFVLSFVIEKLSSIDPTENRRCKC